MIQLTNPAWWASLAALVLGALGVSDPGMQADVKAVVGGVAGLVVAVYVHEHHATVRNQDTAAAAVQTAHATVATAQAAIATATAGVSTAPTPAMPANRPQSTGGNVTVVPPQSGLTTPVAGFPPATA